MKNIEKYLLDNGIKPSPQRVEIMRYLLDHKTHPTVDEIYDSLHPLMPTLSKTTVYNTVKLFASCNMILTLSIDENGVSRYDGDTSPHVHFMCERCRRVFDIPFRGEGFIELMDAGAFQVKEMSLYLKGLCPGCIKQTIQAT